MNKRHLGEFPDGPVIRTRHIHCGGLRSILGQGTKFPQARWWIQIIVIIIEENKIKTIYYSA